MIKGVLFDLDGTLLDIDMDALLAVYFENLAPVVAPLFGTDLEAAIDLVNQGTRAMFAEHPGSTNEEAFNAFIFEQTGLDLSESENSAPLDKFYADVFPTFQGRVRPFEHTSRALEMCRELGLPVGIATQPIFPKLAQCARLKWAGVDTFEFAAVSSYENSYSTKPDGGYFKLMAERIGVAPEHCVMVGDEPLLDMKAKEYGFKTFYVGSKPQIFEADGTGSLADFIEFVRDISSR